MKEKSAKPTIGIAPPPQTRPEYQIGGLAAVFIVMLLLKYSFFGYTDFRLAFLSIGLIAAVILCGNVRLKLTCSKNELLVAFGLFSSIVVILFLIGYDEGATTTGLQKQFDFLDNVVAAPASEEAFYRLFLLNLFVGLTGRRFQGLVVTSILFDLNHISVRYAENPNSVVPAMIIGIGMALILGIVFLYSQNLGSAIAAHSAFNFVAYLRFFPFHYSAVMLILLPSILVPSIHHIYIKRHHVEGTVLSKKWYFHIQKGQGTSGLGIVLLLFSAFGSYLFLLQFYIDPTGYKPLYQLDSGLTALVAIYILIGIILLAVDALYHISHKK